MSEINTFSWDSRGEVKSGIKPNIINPKIEFEEFKQYKDNGNANKIKVKRLEKIATQEKSTKEQLSWLKEEIWFFEWTEPNTQLCSYTWLKIKFPWKKIKNIISVTSSTWWTISNIKQDLNGATFDYKTPSEPKEIEKSELINKDTIEFNWITPNTDNSILTFTVELEDWTNEIIKRKVKLKNKPFIVKEPKKRKWWKNDKVLTEKIEENVLLIWRFIWETPDTKNKSYKDLTLEFSVLPWKEIKRVLSVDTGIANGKSNWPLKNISVIDGNKIKFDYLTPNAGWVPLKMIVLLADWTIAETRKNISLPNNKEVSPEDELKSKSNLEEILKKWDITLLAKEENKTTYEYLINNISKINEKWDRIINDETIKLLQSQLIELVNKTTWTNFVVWDNTKIGRSNIYINWIDIKVSVNELYTINSEKWKMVVNKRGLAPMAL